MTGGALLAARSLGGRRRWEAANRRAAIALDWDDVQAVATRLLDNSDLRDPATLLRLYRDNGATHLSIPELSLNRLLAGGAVNTMPGTDADRVYLQANSAALAGLLVDELVARLPHIDAAPGQGNTLSFRGDLPTVAEVGLGFDPAHAALATAAGLGLVARPIGFSWMQPEMIDRTLAQAAALGASIIAVQGMLVPGHEFNLQYTVATMRRHRLVFAYFRESRHQKGDWFLAKHLAGEGLVLLAHEFTPTELLGEDLHTAAYRWGNLAKEAGTRFCSVRFFRILHAADPLESVEYVHEIAHALHHAGLEPMPAAPPDLSGALPRQDRLALAGVGLAAGGAVGLATDLLPLPDGLKLFKGVGAAAFLAALPFVKLPSGGGHHHHQHDHGHGHDHPHEHHHADEHDHGHHHHHGPAPAPTAYAQKGLALAATAAFPAAAAAVNGPAACVLAQSAVIAASSAAAISATTVDGDTLLGIEEYRGYNLDWLFPLGMVAANALQIGKWQIANSKIGWGPAMVVGLTALASVAGKLPADLPGTLDREHRHAHTHHLSQFQAKLGDARLALSPRPLRKWALLAPLGAASAAALKQAGLPHWAWLGRWAAVEGQVSLQTGFRQGQRSLADTARPRAQSWLLGAGIAAGVWLAARLLRGTAD